MLRGRADAPKGTEPPGSTTTRRGQVERPHCEVIGTDRAQVVSEPCAAFVSSSGHARSGIAWDRQVGREPVQSSQRSAIIRECPH